MQRSQSRRKEAGLDTLVTSDGDKVEVRRLFVTHKNKVKPLSLDRLRNDLKWTMGESGLNVKDWTPHSLRGASASKCINIGLDSARVLEHGRWLSWQTFKKHYLRIDFFGQSSQNNHNLPVWKALRTPVTSVDTSNLDGL